MNKRNILFNISLLILFGFAIFGLVTGATILHELSHKQDYKEVAHDGELCGLVIPNDIGDLWNGAAGYYSFHYNVSSRPEVDRIDKFTERKAYTVMYALTLIFIVSLFGLTRGER